MNIHPPAMDFFTRNLDDREYQELSLKGYLKLKMEIPVVRLKDFDQTFRSGTDVIFHYKGKDVRTVITSVDVAKESTDHKCKVFLGFAPK